MNYINITGGKKYQRDIALKVIRYMIYVLLPKIKIIDIEVVFKTIKESYGYATQLDNREFEIELDKNVSIVELVETLCHEMVHIRQYVRKKLNDSGTKWDNQQINSEEIDYHDLPWEKEAYNLEEKLTQMVWDNYVIW